MSKLFNLCGIKSPGRVNLMKLGTVDLENLSDENAIEVYKSGCPFLTPSLEGYAFLYPDMAPIGVRDIEMQTDEPEVPKKKTKKRN